MNWYYDIEGRSNGPVTESSLKRMAREGEISDGTLLWHPGLEEWEPLAKLHPEIAEQLNKAATPLPVAGKTGSIPQLKLEKQGDPSVIKRLFGWGKKK